MFHVPDYFTSISQRLSAVLADIGVSEKMVLKRRRSCLLVESLDNTAQTCKIYDQDISGYFIGSQIEGTTTLGLQSDADIMYSFNRINVIQDWSEWTTGHVNLMMIRDGTTSPGYCYLQRLRNDAKLPSNEVPNEDYIKDENGRVMLKNTHLDKLIGIFGDEDERHGPSYLCKGPSGYTGASTDLVLALPCKSPPRYARRWFRKQKTRIWNDRTTCFVVAVASKTSDNKELEWRISTAVAERYLTFSLNITQMRCYILMKMILKTHKSQCGNALTSYICKTALFHCISKTGPHFWRDDNLLTCFQYYLYVLQNCLISNNCPHFLLQGNNLMAGRILPDSKLLVIQIIADQLQSGGGALLEIEIDDLSRNIQINFSTIAGRGHFRLESEVCSKLSVVSTVSIAAFIATYHQAILSKAIKFVMNIPSLTPGTHNGAAIYFTLYHQLSKLPTETVKFVAFMILIFMDKMWAFCDARSELYKTAFNLISPFICTTIGSVMASCDIRQDNAVTQKTFDWFQVGLTSDVSSSRLKLASVWYGLGDMDRCESLLNIVENSYEADLIETVCSCWLHEPFDLKAEFSDFCDDGKETAVRYVTSFCVRFLPLEINCVPKELQYEMFRVTSSDFPSVTVFDHWMGMAVVDSLPYLHFLKYKVCHYLQRHSDKQKALSALEKTIKDSVLGHRETAYNLLGQCMELENRPVDALNCYLKSRNIHEHKNAANIHICRLLSSLINV